MSKKEGSNPEKPFVVYRMNKGYYYGPGAGAKLEGKRINWGSSNPHFVVPEEDKVNEIRNV